MGSYDMCNMTGYICRLCSELNKNVIHIFSDKGREMKLAEMINYIPISVYPYDSLPQTVCRTCIGKLETQYKLVEQIKKARKRFIEQAECPIHDNPLTSSSSSSENDSASD